MADTNERAVTTADSSTLRELAETKARLRLRFWQFLERVGTCAFEHLEETVKVIFALLQSTACFLAIGWVAIQLGYYVHEAEINYPWLPWLIIFAGHCLEYLIFVLDVLGLINSVVEHTIGFDCLKYLRARLESKIKAGENKV